jgi:D-beta-D-heptose 7-phosphate kinase / D-beta-D-heptose 1-phosphate adenosyltransferase
MNDNLLETVQKFDSQRVLVIGDAMLDTYLRGEANRICREAPVPIVSVSECAHVPGGAANTAMNARAVGAMARFLSVVGTDADADELLSCLDGCGIGIEDVLRDPERTTLSKRRVLADEHLLLRFDQGSTSPVDGQQELRLLELLEEAHAWCDAIIVSDYGYGILTPGVRHRLAQLQRRSPRIIALDAKRYDLYQDAGVQAIKPNRGEALALLGPSPPGESDVDHVLANGPRLLNLTGVPLAAVTFDRDGAIMLERERTPHRVFARAQASPNTAGAGDTYIATLAVALSAGASAPSAAELAGAAADIAVTKNGTAVCTAAELKLALTNDEKHLRSLDELRLRTEQMRAAGARIVMTSGCFDILHRGHVVLLSRAKALGDVLIVALNTDAGVQRLKGSGRPINVLDDRAHILAAMSCVDYVVPFDAETPTELIRALRPDLYAKGGDYVREMLPEADSVEQAGGQVVILPYVSDLSTSRVIDRAQRSARAEVDGALELSEPTSSPEMVMTADEPAR